MHINMFSQGHSRSEVRAGLNAHQKRDSRVLGVLDLVLGACLLYLVRNQPALDAVVLFIAVVAALSGMRYFIDQSVRNFYLHRLDWEDAQPDD
jgi:hypothetical protein